MSTRGSVVSTAATSLDRGVTTLKTPGRDVGVLGDEPAELAGHPRGVRRGLEHDGAAGGQRRADLGQVDLGRHVPRRDRGDDADRLAAYGPPALDAHRRGDAEVGLELVGLEPGRRPTSRPSTGTSKPAAPIMKPGMPTSAVVSARKSSAWSSSAWCSWRRQRTRSSTVGRPVGLVEGPTGGGDRRLDVGGGGVGRLADLRARGRVEDRVRRAVAAPASACRRSAAGAAGGRVVSGAPGLLGDVVAALDRRRPDARRDVLRSGSARARRGR